MKINLISDVHLDIQDDKKEFTVSCKDADVIVVAGDISNDIYKTTKWLVDTAEFCQKNNQKLIFVAGNHDFWNSFNYSKCTQIFDNISMHYDNFTFLHNDYIDIDGVRLFGGTMFTSIVNPMDKLAVSNMPDFKYIHENDKSITPDFFTEEHEKFKKAFDDMYDSTKKNVIITHYAPSMVLCSDEHKNDEKTCAFIANDMDQYIEKADVWMFGHTHRNFNIDYIDCKLVSNQRGYSSSNWVECPEFDKDFIIQI